MKQESELHDFSARLEKILRAYEMKISIDKSKILIDSYKELEIKSK